MCLYFEEENSAFSFKWKVIVSFFVFLFCLFLYTYLLVFEDYKLKINIFRPKKYEKYSFKKSLCHR